MKANAQQCLAALLVAIGLAALTGCGSRYSALSPGNQAPAVQAAGWTNGGPPEDLEGNVVVLEMFATW